MFRILIIVYLLQFLPYPVSCDDQAILNRLQEVEVHSTALEVQLQECQTNYQVVTEIIETIKADINLTKTDIFKNTESQEKTKNEENNLKFKVNDLKGVTEMLGLEESCLHYGKMGFSESGEYPIDPDGKSQYLAPIKAHCSLPDGKTTIGKKQEIQVQHCSSNLCFDEEVAYDTPMSQLQSLINSSISCSQEITLKCLLAPTEVNDVEHFKWTDANGNQHALVGGTCNTPIPAWKNQTTRITDKDVLPVQKISYRPLIHEGQSLKVIIGPLVCEPKPMDDLAQVTLQTQMNQFTETTQDLKTALKNEIENMTESLDIKIKAIKIKTESLETKTETLKTNGKSQETRTESLEKKVDSLVKTINESSDSNNLYLETHVKEVTEKIDILENVVNNLEEESNLSESEWKIEIENLTESMEANKNLWEAKLNEATLQLKTDLGKVEKELKSNHVEKLDPNVDVENDSFILENDVRTQISEVRKIASENKEILNEFKQQIEGDCPISDGRYKLIMNQCYFFDSGTKNYSAAQDYCKTAFGEGTFGKLFEPTNMYIFNLMIDAASSILGAGGYPWIGFEKHENTWKHASNNLISSQIHPWNVNLDSNNEQYLHFKIDSSNSWDTEGPSDSDSNPSVCQMFTNTEFLVAKTDEKFERQINEVINEVKPTEKNCPSDDVRYKSIMNQCYFFDSGTKNFSAAQDYCKTAFGEGTLGKLFEPTNMYILNLTINAASSVLGTGGYPWIGFEKHDNTWKHASNNLIAAQIHPWNVNLDSNNEQYLHFKIDSSNSWDTEGPSDSDSNPSVCQLITATEFLLIEFGKRNSK